jgi:signal transduction histidine kinase
MAAGDELLSRPDLSAGERTQCAVQASQLKESDLDRITLDVQTALAADANFHGRSESLQRNLPPLARDLTEATEAFLALLNPLAATERPTVSRSDFAAAGTRARALSFQLSAEGSRELDRLLQQRIDDLNRARAWGLGLVALSVVLTAGITVIVARSINRVEQKIRDLNATLEHRVEQRTAEIEAANKELESFSYSVSHDLRAPLRGIAGFTEALSRNYRTRLDAEGGKYLDRVLAGAERMGHLIDDLLNLSRVGRVDFVRRPVNLSTMARSVAENLQQTAPQRQVEWVIADGITVEGDSRLLHVVLENLLGNAWKFTAKRPAARIEFGSTPGPAGGVTCHVRDNGAGFDMAYAAKLFDPFQRLHSLNEFPGTGIGLATVRRIIQRHGGQVRAEAKVDAGATLYFSL